MINTFKTLSKNLNSKVKHSNYTEKWRKLDSISRLKQIVRTNSERVFLIDDIDHSEITFKELETEASKIASNLLNLGLKKGDRIAIIMENSASLVK